LWDGVSSLHHPRVPKDFGDRKSVVNVTIEHRADEVNAVFREGKEWDSEGVVKDLIDIVERVLLVYDGVEENAQSPDILLLASVRSSLEDFGRGIV
jgi:hypothetical protein